MPYRVLMSPEAERQLERLPRVAQDRIAALLRGLPDNPRPAGCLLMKGGEGLWRLRVGDYRIIYTIEDAILLVTVVKVAHRREVYREQ